MPVESGTTISELDDLWPLSTDGVNGGDNHVRLIKSILKSQFPGSGGDGFASPITATEAELNYVDGVTSPIQTQLNTQQSQYQSNLYAPTNTVMLFVQSAPPTGWTQLTSFDNGMLRVVNSLGGSTGGTDSPISWSSAHTHTTGDHTLTIAEMPTHSHQVSNFDENEQGSGAFTQGSGAAQSPLFTDGAGGNGSHNHGPTGSSGPTFTPRYMNVIQAQKS